MDTIFWGPQTACLRVLWGAECRIRGDWHAHITTGMSDIAMLPKVVWMLWLQGWHEAPEIVRACRRSWEALSPRWIVAPLSEKTAFRALCGSKFIEAISDKGLQPEALSDCIRIELLRRYGGVWADATTYCLKPLD
jgi:mannosyltransferase OCH1-like enzyme